MSAGGGGQGGALPMLVVVAALALLALFAGADFGGDNPTDNGGSHVAGRGLTGFAALGELLAAEGYPVIRARHAAAWGSPGVLVLTPNFATDAQDLNRAWARHARFGATLVILPKWITRIDNDAPGAKPGWTRLLTTRAPEYRGFADDVAVGLARADGPAAGGWRLGWLHRHQPENAPLTGRLPNDHVVLAGAGETTVPLVLTHDGRMLAGYHNDGQWHRGVAALAGVPDPDVAAARAPEHVGPLVFVFEPDLLNNQGLADPRNGALAQRLFAALGRRDQPVIFDLTLVGLAERPSLAALAGKVPFLPALLCLGVALALAAWRATVRLAPARAVDADLGAGKTALVRSTAMLIRRSGRLHLITRPWVAAWRERASRRHARALPAAAEAALATLDSTRRPGAALAAAQDLARLEQDHA